MISLSTSKFCRECGKSIPANASSCSGCGHPVGRGSPPPQSVADTVLKPSSAKPMRTLDREVGVTRSAQEIGRYQIADGFLLNTKTGDVWKYDENSNKLKIVEREDSVLTSVEKAKAYIDQSVEIDRLVGAWEEQLSEIGDDVQLANIDLQNNLQKQQQTMQMLSNISKVMHDTAMAIIRNLK